MSKSMLRVIADNDLAAVRELVYRNVHSASEIDPVTGRNALHEAALQGRSEILAALLEYVLIGAEPDRHGDTPLLLALQAGNLDCARVLLSRQSQLWRADEIAIIRLVKSGFDDAELAEALYRRGVPLRRSAGEVDGLAEAQSKGLNDVAAVMRSRLQSQQQLFAALLTDDADTVQALIASHQVDVNDHDEHGWTPLARAIQAGSLAAIDALCDASADLDCRLPGGSDMLSLALESAPGPVTRRLIARFNYSWNGSVCSEPLRDAINGPNDDPRDVDTMTSNFLQAQALNNALAATAWRGKPKLSMSLALRGGRLPTLAPAAQWGDLNLLEQLHMDGAIANGVSREGLPMLHLLALGCGNSLGVASRLLELGADLSIRHPDHGSAIEFADAQGRHELAAHLRSHSAVAAYSWQREARAAGVSRIVFAIGKTRGATFNPNNADLPLEVGGDNDGAWPVSAASGLVEVQRCGLYAELGQGVRGILEKLARNEDFGLADVLAVVGEGQVQYRQRSQPTAPQHSPA